MFKRILVGMVFLLSFCLIFAFSTGYAKSEKADDKGNDIEKVEKVKKDSDDESDDEKGKQDKDTGKKDDDDKNKKDKDGKVTICHYPSGDKEKGQTISIASEATEKHIKEHGDTYGACAGDTGSEVEKKLKSWWEFWK